MPRTRSAISAAATTGIFPLSFISLKVIVIRIHVSFKSDASLRVRSIIWRLCSSTVSVRLFRAVKGTFPGTGTTPTAAVLGTLSAVAGVALFLVGVRAEIVIAVIRGSASSLLSQRSGNGISYQIRHSSRCVTICSKGVKALKVTS